MAPVAGLEVRDELLVGVANVFESFIGTIRPHVELRFESLGRADPSKLSPVEFHRIAAQDLIKVDSGLERSPRPAVGFCQVVNIIRRHERTAAGHVLNDHGRLSGQILAEILGDQAAPEIDSAPGGGSNNDLERFAFEVRMLLRSRSGAPAELNTAEN